MSDVFGIMNGQAVPSWICSVVGHGYDLDQTWMGLEHILGQPGKTGGTRETRAKRELPANDLILPETCHYILYWVNSQATTGCLPLQPAYVLD